MNKDQALGYLLLAMKEANISYKDMEKLHKQFNLMMDLKSEEEAKKEGEEWWSNYRREQHEKIERQLHSKITLME